MFWQMYSTFIVSFFKLLKRPLSSRLSHWRKSSRYVNGFPVTSIHTNMCSLLCLLLFAWMKALAYFYDCIIIIIIVLSILYSNDLFFFFLPRNTCQFFGGMMETTGPWRLQLRRAIGLWWSSWTSTRWEFLCYYCWCVLCEVSVDIQREY